MINSFFRNHCWFSLTINPLLFIQLWIKAETILNTIILDGASQLIILIVILRILTHESTLTKLYSSHAFQLATWNPITYIELVTFHWICVECWIYQMYWIFYLYLFYYSKDFFFVVGGTSHVEREFTIAFCLSCFAFTLSN